ncbi:DUF86 domain-containing protein [Caldivirga sp. UBA161]|uniref:DUF86 domain-containing protein n=1 Tax=Caldivirga sp. UBA161 TaxID=1915569 RepID=UPI0025BB0376|nr:DUF86 domain-containing protein [Caldivirga sp. UBA161]
MGILDRLLNEIKDISVKLDEAYVNDWLTLMGATHALQVQSQALIDIIERLLANMGISVMGYRDAAVKLRELGLLNDEEYRFLLTVIGFRNIVIHEYTSVDFNLVRGILSRREYRRLLELALKLRERAKNYWDP